MDNRPYPRIRCQWMVLYPRGAEPNVLSVSFGDPTPGQVAAGFWSWPVVVCDATGGEVGRIGPDGEVGWERPWAQGEVRVISSERVDGWLGPSVTARVRVPEGCRVWRGRAGMAVSWYVCPFVVRRAGIGYQGIASSGTMW